MQISYSSLLQSPASLCAENHRDYGFIQANNRSESSNNLFIPIALFEFINIANHYPIFFLGEDDIFPVAITGLNAHPKTRSEKNTAIYIPALKQLYPFALHKLPDQPAGVLIFDKDSEQIALSTSNREAAALFDNNGEPTDTLRRISKIAAQFYTSHAQAKQFALALKEAGILTPSKLEFKIIEDGIEKLHPFYMINEQRYRNLPAHIVHSWHQKGWLDAASLINFSHIHWYRHLKSAAHAEQT